MLNTFKISRKACDLMQTEFEAMRKDTFVIQKEGSASVCVLNTANSREYTVHTKKWDCSCHVRVTYLIPCRHIAFVRHERGVLLYAT